jgi:DNA-binding transcriptional ArsR family regulator
MNEQMEKMKELVLFFKAFSDQTRMRLIRAIASGMAGKISVNDLAKKLGVAQPTVSQHLRILRGISLIEPERDGYNIYYRINKDTLNKYKTMNEQMLEIIFTECDQFPQCEK